MLDRMWQMQLDAAADWDDGMVEIGGFCERRSAMPSFHKSSRDRDWGMR
jgi:hypothetical protein